jgi:hypothetical protein
MSPELHARMSTRSHSTSVKSDATMRAARRRSSATSSALGSPSSHASTALDSA